MSMREMAEELRKAEETIVFCKNNSDYIKKRLFEKNKIIDEVIEFCDYLLEHNEVIINGKTYIKQNGDDIITNAIKNKLLGGDE